MKSALIVGLLLKVAAASSSFEACDGQQVFNIRLCNSWMCNKCTFPWCVEKCQEVQGMFATCRCKDWPASRATYSSGDFAGKGGFGVGGDYDAENEGYAKKKAALALKKKMEEAAALRKQQHEETMKEAAEAAAAKKKEEEEAAEKHAEAVAAAKKAAEEAAVEKKDAEEAAAKKAHAAALAKQKAAEEAAARSAAAKKAADVPIAGCVWNEVKFAKPEESFVQSISAMGGFSAKIDKAELQKGAYPLDLVEKAKNAAMRDGCPLVSCAAGPVDGTASCYYNYQSTVYEKTGKSLLVAFSTKHDKYGAYSEMLDGSEGDAGGCLTKKIELQADSSEEVQGGTGHVTYFGSDSCFLQPGQPRVTRKSSPKLWDGSSTLKVNGQLQK